MFVLTSILSCAVVLLSVLLVAVRLTRKTSKDYLQDQEAPNCKKPPGPKSWPIIGNLHLLGQHENPFIAFTELSKVYGDVFSMVLGTIPCVVVNNYTLIKEVLIAKGAHFGGRPDFIRFHKLFGGDRNNSLALCDWSDLQKTRRQIARLYCSPRLSSLHYDTLARVTSIEIDAFINRLTCSMTSPTSSSGSPQPIYVKPLVQAACANMFSGYMCTTRFEYDDPAFRNIVRLFDEIFWEINQGYAVDFLPWLAPAYRGHMEKLSSWAQDIRTFILSRIIDEHRRTLSQSENEFGEPREARDFTDALLIQLEEDPHLTWQHIIFELEDFLGGHSAVGNLTMLTLAALAKYPEVAARIQAEVDTVTGGVRTVELADKANMPYTDAVILETLRLASSPIVPHVATQDTSIAGYAVEKGTVVFINNYELNVGEAYWEEPKSFKPERFLQTGKDGVVRVVKPSHFIPFSTGKRTCIGQRLVQSGCFALLAAVAQRFNVTPVEGHPIVTYTASVALPPDTFPLAFSPRGDSR